MHTKGHMARTYSQNQCHEINTVGYTGKCPKTVSYGGEQQRYEFVVKRSNVKIEIS